MDYPHANVGHHNHNRRDDDDRNNNMYNPPPPSPQPPSPFSHSPYPPAPAPAPAPPHLNPAYPQPTAAAYNLYPPPPHVESHHYPPPGVPSQSSHTPHVGGPELGLGHLASRPSHKIHCKAGAERFSVGIRHHKLVLTHPDHSDPTQHWYKDEKYSTKVKDKEGHPSFMLVNKATGQAVKHSISCHPVQLAPYKPDVLDESVLWTESKDLGSGFRTIRTVNNIHLVMDAWNADKDHGGIHDGTLIALYETWKGDNQNQQWKFARH